jgi:hypothetical protein
LRRLLLGSWKKVAVHGSLSFQMDLPVTSQKVSWDNFIAFFPSEVTNRRKVTGQLPKIPFIRSYPTVTPSIKRGAYGGGRFTIACVWPEVPVSALSRNRSIPNYPHIPNEHATRILSVL